MDQLNSDFTKFIKNINYNIYDICIINVMLADKKERSEKAEGIAKGGSKATRSNSNAVEFTYIMSNNQNVFCL